VERRNILREIMGLCCTIMLWHIFITKTKRTETKPELHRIKGLWRLQRNYAVTCEMLTLL